MSTLLLVLLIIDTVLLLGLLVYVVVRSKKEDCEESCICCKEETCVPAPVAQEKQPEVAPVVEEPVAEPVVEETPVETVESASVEVVEDDKGLVITAIDDDDDDKESIKPVPFCEKMLYIDKKTQEYFNVLNNEFIALRKINDRVSSKGVSYRLGRELVAKITLRGKTLKLHLALPVADYPANIYFQKDMSDVKAYAEVPFTVKVRSDRALKNAIKLISALCEVKQIAKKTRFTPVDAVEELKVIAAKLK